MKNMAMFCVVAALIVCLMPRTGTANKALRWLGSTTDNIQEADNLFSMYHLLVDDMEWSPDDIIVVYSEEESPFSNINVDFMLHEIEDAYNLLETLASPNETVFVFNFTHGYHSSENFFSFIDYPSSIDGTSADHVIGRLNDVARNSKNLIFLTNACYGGYFGNSLAQ